MKIKTLLAVLFLGTTFSYAQVAVNAHIDQVVEGVFDYSIFQSTESSKVVLKFKDVQYTSVDIYQEVSFVKKNEALEFIEAINNVMKETNNVNQQYVLPNGLNGIRTSGAFKLLFKTGNGYTYITSEQVETTIDILK